MFQLNDIPTTAGTPRPSGASGGADRAVGHNVDQKR